MWLAAAKQEAVNSVSCHLSVAWLAFESVAWTVCGMAQQLRSLCQNFSVARNKTTEEEEDDG